MLSKPGQGKAAISWGSQAQAPKHVITNLYIAFTMWPCCSKCFTNIHSFNQFDSPKI